MVRLAAALDRMGRLTQQPLSWVGAATLLAAGGGAKGRRAALRGAVCYTTTSVVANLVIKPLIQRRRPPEARRRPVSPITSSFPSGHAASDLAFACGVGHELPALFPLFALVTSTAHWSLVRSRSHYLSDVPAGGVLGIAAASTIKRLWPTAR